jgi:hypothetical protein
MVHHQGQQVFITWMGEGVVGAQFAIVGQVIGASGKHHLG